MKKLIFTSLYGVSVVLISIFTMYLIYPVIYVIDNSFLYFLTIVFPLISLLIGIYICYKIREDIIDYKVKKIFNKIKR